jgi:SAM-dependent methyltransferase
MCSVSASLKGHLRKLYYALLNLLHRPLLLRGDLDPFHQVFREFHTLIQEMQSPVVLEIGARNVTGETSRRRLFPSAGRYIGFDLYSGEEVNVVGDAHQLTNYFPPNSIDAILSVSVFEHLAFPWKVVLEMNRVLKVGGLVFVATHPAWPPHELPCDFWRYPVAGLSTLFIRETGFEIISATEGLPCKAYSLVTDPPTRGFFKFQLNMGVAVIAKKISEYDSVRLRWDVNVNELVSSSYPVPHQKD